MTKIDIISGFLGAGKTTLIKKLISDGLNNEKLVLIENEFGEIGIDGGFLKDSGIQITEMNSGCICCSLVGDFGVALEEVLKTYNPDRIIIEPSGVGKLSDVITAVSKVVNDEVKINSLVAVADAKKCKMYIKNFGEFFNNQIESAKTVILSRTQLLSEDKLNDCVAQLKELNPSAVVVTTPWDDITGEQILSTMEEQRSFAQQVVEEHMAHEHEHHHEHDENCTCGCHDHDHEHEHHHDHDHEHDENCTCGCHDHDHEHEHHHDHDHDHEHDENCTCGCHDHDHDHEHHHDHDHHHEHEHDENCTCGCHDHEHHHHHADEVFTSWGVQTTHKYTKEELEVVLDKLANTTELGSILRAKGIVPSAQGEWFYFDLTPGEVEIRTGAADISGKLCVIGVDLKEDEIAKAFKVA